jgi:hypothetical protein
MRYKTALRKDIKPGQKFTLMHDLDVIRVALTEYNTKFMHFKKHTYEAYGLLEHTLVVLCDDGGNPIPVEFPIKGGERALFRRQRGESWFADRLKFIDYENTIGEPFNAMSGQRCVDIAVYHGNEDRIGTTGYIPGAYTAGDL